MFIQFRVDSSAPERIVGILELLDQIIYTLLCSTQIEVELDGNIVKNVKFTGGCQGNLQAIPRLVEGMTVEEVERRISGIHCGMKNTSCGDQLARALREAYDAQKNA